MTTLYQDIRKMLLVLMLLSVGKENLGAQVVAMYLCFYRK